MVTPGIYQHFKGNKYRVIGVGLIEATETPAVVYEALYDNDKSKLWIRPVEEFESTVEVGGKTVARFKRLDDEPQNI